MANEIKIKVTSENATRREFNELKGDLKDVETASDKAGNKIHELGDESKTTGEHVKGMVQPVVVAGGEMRNLGTKVQGVRSDLKALETGMATSRAALSQLTSAFAQTDDAAQRVDIKKAISKIQSDLSSASKAHKLKLAELVDLEPSPSDVKRFVTKIADGIESAGPLIPTAIGAGILASPLIGAAVSGAVIGGAGIGGVVGGVILASKDPRVKSAFTATATELKTQLTDASSSFIQPTIAAIRTVGNSVKGIDFKSIFSDASRFLAPLASGVSAFISGISSGIKDLVHNAGPAVAVISQEIGQLGSILGKGFSDMSKNSKAGADGLRALLDVVNATVAGTLALVNGLATVYKWGEKIGATLWLEVLNLSMRDATGLAQDAGGAMVTLTKKILGVGEGSKDATNGIQTLSEHLADITGVARNLFSATTNVGEAIDTVTAAAKKNGKTLDENTAKGRDNRTALMGLATALQAQYDATVAANGAGVKADRVAANNRESFIKLATSLTGSSRKARELADQILGIPPKRDVKVNANTHDAEGRLKALQDKINGTHGKTVQMTINYNYRTFGKPGTGGGLATGGITPAIAGHAAEGGPRSGLTLVGEHGPELADLAPGTRVHSNGDSMRMLGQGGSQPIVFKFSSSGNRVLDELFRWLLERMQEVTRTEYHSDVTLMLGGAR